MKPKHGLSASRDETLHMHVLFLLRCATKDTLCAVISHDIRVRLLCIHTRVSKLLNLLLSVVFLDHSQLILFTLPNIAEQVHVVLSCIEISSCVLVLPLHWTDKHTSLKQLQPNMQIWCWSLYVYLIWSLFLDFSLFFFSIFCTLKLSYNYGTCS